ncbi:MAG: hypothetical protein PVH29_14560 [Candidatus Zixiibacteriota bacterium]|jgi:hypothetical protein
MISNDEGVRKLILTALYKRNQKKPGCGIDYDELYTLLPEDTNAIDRAARYLKEKGLIEATFQLPRGNLGTAKITAAGIDFVETF